MVLELATIVGVVEGIGTIVKTASSALENIRGKNKEAQKQLNDNITKLQTALKQSGNLAQAAESYARTLENVIELRLLCERMEDFLNDNISECRIPQNNKNYEGNWKVLQTLLQIINQKSEVSRQVVLQCVDWFDKEDGSQLNTLLQDYAEYLSAARIEYDHRQPDNLIRNLVQMKGRLQKVETRLQATLYNKILKALKSLGS